MHVSLSLEGQTKKMETLLRTTQPSTSSFNCEFVQKPPEVIQSLCPMCLKILCEPYQAPCCGKSFCRLCIEQTKEQNKPCPTCNEENAVFFHNKGLEISLNGFQVYCPYKQEGCEWMGELGQLGNHLNLSSQPDKQLEGCKYSEIECIFCSELIKHQYIVFHQTEHCPKRPFSCEYCHSYESHYEDVINNHWPVCGYQTVQCPNECGTSLKRQALENHITGGCPNTVIDCDFHHVGCDVKLPRKDMPAHLKADLITHMSLQAARYKQLQERVNKLEHENETLKHQLQATQTQLETTQAQVQTTQQTPQNSQQIEQQLATLQLMSNAERNTVQQIVKHLKLWKVNKVEITMHNYRQQKTDNSTWYSQPFYTYPGGYKLCLQIKANGCSSGRGTHVSLCVHLMRGEFDDQLSWPFLGEVTIEILDRHGGSYKKTIQFNSSTPVMHNSRVTQGERTRGGWGFPTFIPHYTLQPLYVHNDCINFCIKYKELNATNTH